MLFTTVCQSISLNSKMALLDVTAFTIPEYSNGKFGSLLRRVIEIAVIINEYQSGSYQPLVPACTADASRATTFHFDLPSRILSLLTITLSNVSYIPVSYFCPFEGIHHYRCIRRSRHRYLRRTCSVTTDFNPPTTMVQLEAPSRTGIYTRTLGSRF